MGRAVDENNRPDLKSDPKKIKPKIEKCGFVEIPYKNFKEKPKAHAMKRRVIYKILPYLLFPYDEKNFDILSIRLSQQMLHRFKNLKVGKHKKSTGRKIRIAERKNIRNSDVSHYEEGYAYYIREAKNEYKNLHFICKLVENLLAQSMMCANGDAKKDLPRGPSLENARRVLTSKQYHKMTDDKNLLSEYSDFYEVWGKYKGSAHIIFGFLHSSKAIDFSLAKLNPYKKVLQEALSYSKYVQDFLLALDAGPNAKKPFIADGLLWKLPDIKWAPSLMPNRIQPISRNLIEIIRQEKLIESAKRANKRKADKERDDSFISRQL